MPKPTPNCKGCGSPDKLPGRNLCKICFRKHQNDQRAARADEINAKARERYANDPEYRAKLIESVKGYQNGSGREARLAYEKSRLGAPGRTWKEWADKNGNRERKREQERERYRTDSEFRARKIRHALVRSRKTAKGDLTVMQWEAIIAMFHGICAYCPQPYQHLEHMTPLARGGEHTAANVVPACAPCNLSKGSKTVDEWLASRATCAPVGR